MIRAFFDLLAKMGLSVRDDPPKVIDLSLYTFGEPLDGLVLAVRQIPRADREAVPTVSLVLRNASETEKIFVVLGWLGFYRLHVHLPDGSPVSLTPFGRALAKPGRQQERLRVVLAPGAFHETEIPLGSIFSMRARTSYTVSATCSPSEGAPLESNRITLS